MSHSQFHSILLYLDMHGLVLETSIWLLAGSTRLLPLRTHRVAHKFNYLIWRSRSGELRGFVTCGYWLWRYKAAMGMPITGSHIHGRHANLWVLQQCRSTHRICTEAHKHTLLARTGTISHFSSYEDSRWTSLHGASRPVVVKRVGWYRRVSLSPELYIFNCSVREP